MITPDACAASALRTFSPKLHVASLDQGDLALMKSAKSDAVQPLAEPARRDGMTIPPASFRSAVGYPLIGPGFHSVTIV